METGKKSGKGKKEAVCCLVFLLLLYGLWTADLLCPDRLYSDWEKRLLAQKPAPEAEDVLNGSYMEAYEEWLTDQFPARDRWIGLKTRCELLLGKKEIDGIFIGKDGYLFSESDQTADWDRLEAQAEEQFGEETVSRIHVPAAGAVLTEKVPYGISFSMREDAISQNLTAHRAEYIYYRTDHHWTMLGAYYAYEAWAKERGLRPVPLSGLLPETVREDFLGSHYARLHYAEREDTMELYDPGMACSVVYDLGESDLSGLYQPELLTSEDAYRFFLDGNHGVVQIDTGQGKGHLAVLKDSFANCLIPFLSVHYRKITVVDPRYFRSDPVSWLAGQGVTEVLIVAQDTVTVAVTVQISAGIQPVMGICS